MMLLISCGSKSSFKAVQMKADTLKTIGIFFVEEDSLPRLEYLQEIHKDSFVVDESGAIRKIRDTVINRPRIIPITEKGKPKLDSIGNPFYAVSSVPAIREYILWMAHVRVDSLMKIKKSTIDSLLKIKKNEKR